MKKAIWGSLLIAILHSILFYGQELGISVLLFAVVSVFLLIAFLKKHNKVKNTNAFYLAFPILLLSSTYLIFNNTFFNVVNLFVIPVLLASMIVWACIDTFKLRELVGKSINLVIGSLEFIPGACKLIKNAAKPKQKENDEKAEQYKKLKYIGLGILCSIPLLFIIVGLLVSADGVFANLFDKVFHHIAFIFTGEFIGNLIGRIILIGLVLIYLVCILYNIIIKNSGFNREYKEKEFLKFHIDTTIINTILTIINIVYLIFTGVQFIYLYSYLFSDASLNASLNLAEYARQGFFQLMFITVINFAIILITNANEKKEKTKSKYTKWMNVLMCLFTIVICVSAFMRMHLYESEFGYTFLRLMVYVILITEIIAIIPTIYYVVKNKINLLKSYFIIGITMYVIVNFANIDYMIAKNNINRAEKMPGEYVREIDVDYLINNLGTDAVSEMVYLYHTTKNETDKRKINNYLYNMYQDVKEERSFQEWNLSKNRAKKLLEPLNLEYQRYKKNKKYNDIYEL
ncbi:MAG: DUF4173 domain-containing protein [Clostridia bacterium]|nr:DUF4173 domain-containing protein [Clostridia bacterium]